MTRLLATIRRAAAFDATAERSERAPGMRHAMQWPPKGPAVEQFWFKAGHLVQYQHVALADAMKQHKQEVRA